MAASGVHHEGLEVVAVQPGEVEMKTENQVREHEAWAYLVGHRDGANKVARVLSRHQNVTRVHLV